MRRLYGFHLESNAAAMAGFTVDTHVFRELGELLVGRDSTALVELVKNSYDADAKEVVLYGENLADVEVGFIRVSDDGVGMTEVEFREGFLRIASRAKEEGARVSRRFKRRYTGAKGIGRLAAHKLAKLLEIESFSLNSAAGGVRATIDWESIESHQTLDDVQDLPIQVVNVPPSLLEFGGTTITLRRLRRKWTRTEHGRFLEEIQNFEPAGILTDPLPETIVDGPLLFSRAVVRDAAQHVPFAVKLEGELSPPEDYWVAALGAASWILEIEARPDTGLISYAVAATRQTTNDIGPFATQRYEMPHPAGAAGPFFQGRVLIRTGAVKGAGDLKAWSGRAYGVRVFMEGFRVLPYGEPKNDWLALDRDYAERSKDFLPTAVAGSLVPALPQSTDDRPGLTSLPNKNYFGGIFLTQEGAPTLRLLVNREGFVPDEAYFTLEKVVRVGLDLATRVRAAATYQKREEQRQQRAAAKVTASVPLEGPPLAAVLEDAESHTSAARRFAAAGDVKRAVSEIDQVLAGVRAIRTETDEIADQAAMFRVLASVGTQLSSFVHELNGLLAMAEAVETVLAKLADDLPELKRPSRTRLREVAARAGDLRRHLERHASYLVDVVSPDARRRRSRQRLADRFQSAMRLIDSAATRRGVQISNEIPPDVKSPPMFAAELTAVFANLLTNAVKAAGREGRIRATANSTDKSTTVRVENTGVKVRVSDGERWFRPFESSTTEVDDVLGQGMGLGLTITRRILEEYGATIKFVAPSPMFSTAIEIGFSG
jgi:signal transduction histidine kinase